MMSTFDPADLLEAYRDGLSKRRICMETGIDAPRVEAILHNLEWGEMDEEEQQLLYNLLRKWRS